VTLAHMELRSNAAQKGGGLALHGAQVQMTDVTVQENEASEEGGGVYLDIASSSLISSSLILEQSLFLGNVATLNGGAGYAVYGNTLEARDSRFEANVARSRYAGGLYNATVVHRCWFVQNQATGDSLLGDGGALYLQQAARVTNSIFMGNRAYWGGAIDLDRYVSGIGFEIVNNTFVDNNAISLGEDIYIYFADHVLIRNNIMANFGLENEVHTYSVYSWDLNNDMTWTIDNNNNYFEDGNGFGGEASPDLYNAEDSYSNLASTPLFVAYTPNQFSLADLHLQTNSPCVNSGNQEVGVDLDGSFPDMGAYGGPDPLP